MSDTITIGYNTFKKNKINYVGIDTPSIDDVILNKNDITLRIEISGNKTITIPFKTKKEAIKEFKRISKEMNEPSKGSKPKDLTDLFKDDE